jgi:hypothetical protein
MGCRLWVDGIAMSMNAASLFVLSVSVMSGRLKGMVLSANKV